MFDRLRAKWYQFLTNNSAPLNENQTAAQWRRRHSRVLVRQIQSSLKLQPIALIAESTGAATLAFTFWHEINHWYLFAWLFVIVIHLYGAIDFSRRFWADRYRHARVHLWVRAWMILATLSGVIWAVAGSTFAYGADGHMASQILLVSVILSVTFASWPVYACWLPSLGVFTLLSIAPLVLRMALVFGWSRLAIAILLVGIIAFIFYSGRRFSDIVQMSVRNEQESELMVKRLTLEKNLAEKLRRETQEQSRIRGKFFQAANHDIRQPLQAIGIYIELLKRNDDPQVKLIVEQLAKTTSSLQTLVAQILEISRLETHHMTTTLEPLNVQQVLEDLAEEFAPLAAKKNVGFRVKPLDVNVYTDAQLLQRALRNLITNAINYTNEGEIVLAARLIGGKNVSICVVDSGEGVDKAEQKRIFEHFYRSEKTRETTGGFGLGLSIVRGICEQLGMRLSFSSRLGRGSIFRIQLPLHEAEQVRIFTQARKEKQDVQTMNATVVLIEDNAVVRESLKALLQMWQLKVIAESGYSQALIEKIKNEARIDAIISDYNLGADKANGLEVMLEMNRACQTTIPSILLTAVADDKIQEDYRHILSTLSEEDVQYFALPRIMQKPVSGEDLNEAIRSVLAKES